MAKTARSLRDPKRKPTHPGRNPARGRMPALRMTRTEFAQRLGTSRLTVSEILHEKRPVSVDMAIRIGKLLGNGAGLCLRLQQALDVWRLSSATAMKASSR